LLGKMEKVLEISEKIDSNATRCFSLINKALKHSYRTNKFELMTTKMIKNLKYITNILIIEFLKKELSKSTGPSSASGNVIDVDLAEDS
jgi:hypothetical protein